MRLRASGPKVLWRGRRSAQGGASTQDSLLEACHRRNENLIGHRVFNGIPASNSARYFRSVSKDDQVAQFCFVLTCFAACTSAGEALHAICTHRHALGFKTGLMRHLPSTAQWDPRLSVRARSCEPQSRPPNTAPFPRAFKFLQSPQCLAPAMHTGR